jgi:hypothetical protein
MYQLTEPRESYKTLYYAEKAKKLALVDEVLVLGKENQQLRDHVKRLEIRAASLEHDLKPWLCIE